MDLKLNMIEAEPIFTDAPVKVSQIRDEFSALLEIFKVRQPRSILELGVEVGGTLYCWAKYAPPNALVVGVDSFDQNYEGDPPSLFPTWQHDGIKIIPIKGLSRDRRVIEAVADLGPYSWVFIDTGHTYDEVSADWKTYRPMMSHGALCVFHDVVPKGRAGIEVSKLISELKTEGYGVTTIITNMEREWGGLALVEIP